jgi:hypothetical protein
MLHGRAEHQPADPAKPIDRNPDSHIRSLQRNRGFSLEQIPASREAGGAGLV